MTQIGLLLALLAAVLVSGGFYLASVAVNATRPQEGVCREFGPVRFGLRKRNA